MTLFAKSVHHICLRVEIPVLCLRAVGSPFAERVVGLRVGAIESTVLIAANSIALQRPAEPRVGNLQRPREAVAIVLRVLYKVEEHLVQLIPELMNLDQCHIIDTDDEGVDGCPRHVASQVVLLELDVEADGRCCKLGIGAVDGMIDIIEVAIELARLIHSAVESQMAIVEEVDDGRTVLALQQQVAASDVGALDFGISHEGAIVGNGDALHLVEAYVLQPDGSSRLRQRTHRLQRDVESQRIVVDHLLGNAEYAVVEVPCIARLGERVAVAIVCWAPTTCRCSWCSAW